MPKTVGLIGLGRIGKTSKGETLPLGWRPYNHLDAIKANKNLCLVATCDVETFYNYKTLIDHVRPDIIGIATRTKGRTDIIRYAAEHGVKGIYIEKPISTSLEDCYTALDAVEKNNVNVVYGTQRRFMDIYRRAKDIILFGGIGEIVSIEVGFGRAALLWTHPHTVDTILYFTGMDVEFVQGACLFPPESMSDSGIDADPILETGFIKFNNGITADIFCRPTTNGMNVYIFGKTGTIKILENGSRLELNNINVDVPITISGTQRAYSELGIGYGTGTEHIRVGHQILFALMKSSMSGGKRVKLDELDEKFRITGRHGDLLP